MGTCLRGLIGLALLIALGGLSIHEIVVEHDETHQDCPVCLSHTGKTLGPALGQQCPPPPLHPGLLLGFLDTPSTRVAATACPSRAPPLPA